MSNVFPRQITNPPIRAISSEDCYIVDENGTQYFDGSGGAAVSCLGHDDPDVIKAIQDQTSKMAFAHTVSFQVTQLKN